MEWNRMKWNGWCSEEEVDENVLKITRMKWQERNEENRIEHNVIIYDLSKKGKRQRKWTES